MSGRRTGGFYAPNGPADLFARYSFIEPLVSAIAGCRVLEIGTETGEATAQVLTERGAKKVVSRQALSQLSLEDDEAFDLILVAEGGELAQLDTAKAIAQLLAPGGRLLAALSVQDAVGLSALAGYRPPDSEGLPGAGSSNYQQFVEALSKQFNSVEVGTQAALVGYVVALAGGDGADLTIDGSLGGESEAAYYLALCGETPSGLLGSSLVTLPSRPLAEEALNQLSEEGVSISETLVSDLKVEANVAREALSERENWLAALRREVERLSAELASQEAKRVELQQQLLHQEQAQEKLALLLGQVESRDQAHRKELDELRAQLWNKAEELRRLCQERDEARGAADARAGETEALTTDLADQGIQLEQARAHINRLTARLEEAQRDTATGETVAQQRETSLTELRGAVSKERRRAESHEAESEQLKRRLEEAFKDLATTRESLEEARRASEASGHSAFQRRSALESQLGEMHQLQSVAMAREQELQRRLAESMNHLELARADLESVQSQLGATLEQMTGLEISLSNQKALFADLQNELSAVTFKQQEAAGQFSAQLAEQVQLAAEAKADALEHAQQVGELKGTLEAREADRERYQRERAALAQRIELSEQAYGEVEQARDRSERLRTEQLDATAKELVRSRNDLAELRAGHQNVIHERDRLAELLSQREVIEEEVTQVIDARASVAALKVALDAAQAELRLSREESLAVRRDLQHELSDRAERINRLSAELHELRSSGSVHSG